MMRQPEQSWLLILEKKGLTMGGFLSTRWGDHHKRGVVEECRLVIDAHEVARQGGRRTDRFWDGQRLLPIYYCIEEVPEDADSMQVAIDLAGRAEIQVARLESTHPHFGGVRWWFSCPQCARRCRKLYLPRGQWDLGCRSCHNLTYTSSQTAGTLSGDKLVQSAQKCCAGLVSRLYGTDVAAALIEHLRKMR
jgi:hypothetical protein